MVETTLDSRIRVTDAEAEALLHGLVSIPSLSGHEAEASSFLVDWMSDHGFKAWLDGTGSAVGERGSGTREIVLLGHIDTFPGQIPLRTDGRRLFGRGAVDAKGALAAFAVAAARLDPPVGLRVVVIGASEEEAASSRGARYALNQYRPEACLIGEPSGWARLTLGYKGRLNLTWSWEGGLAHSAGPSLSPAEVTVGAWHWIERYAERFNVGRTAQFQKLSPSLLSIQTTREGAFGHAEMEVNFRLPPDLPPADLEKVLRAGLLHGEMHFSGHEAAFQTSNDNMLTRALRAAIRAEGGQPRHVHKTGTSDMNVVGPVWGCPIAAYGPGDSRLDHTPDEHLDLDEFQHSIRVLGGVLSALAGDPSFTGGQGQAAGISPGGVLPAGPRRSRLRRHGRKAESSPSPEARGAFGPLKANRRLGGRAGNGSPGIRGAGRLPHGARARDTSASKEAVISRRGHWWRLAFLL